VFIGWHCVASGQHFVPTKTSAAVVVKDITRSTVWYSKLFELSISNEMNDPGGSYKIAILESKDLLLELLQMKG
jgi:hypothetical protein